MERNSPLGPGMEVAGKPSAFATGVVAAQPSEHTTPVMKQSSKDGSADPSLGSHTIRAATTERSGARYRVNPVSNHAAPNHPSSGATMANVATITTDPAAEPPNSVEYPRGTNAGFNDAEAVAGRAPGSMRLVNTAPRYRA